MNRFENILKGLKIF